MPKMPKKTKKKTASASPETVLVLRTCGPDLTSHGCFQWPASGTVSAPDWSPSARCGYGLHGLLWGEGDGAFLDWSADAKWLVCRVEKDSIVDLGRKVKFPSCEVIHCGDRVSATEFISANGAVGRAVVGGTSTSGYMGTSNSGYRGTSTSGDGGISTSGYRGTSTSGDGGISTSGYMGISTSGVGGTSNSGYMGTSTSGYGGISTSGYMGISTSGVGGVISILYWNGKRYKARIAQVKDEDGEGELDPNVPYQLNALGEFMAVEEKA